MLNSMLRVPRGMVGREFAARPPLRPWGALGLSSTRTQFAWRLKSTDAHADNDKGTPLTVNTGSDEPVKIDKPTYQLTFTCKQCNGRSSHLVSKQAYHHGTVLVKCPSCENRHLIADHLKIFKDKATTLEEILADQGHKIQKGTLDLNKLGDLQWEDKDHVEDVPTLGEAKTP